MSGFLQKLENNESVLLLYLAGELPEQDRAEVEQMLSSDQALRRELDQLRALLHDTDALMARLDDLAPVAAGAFETDRAAEAFGKLIRNRQADQAQKPEADSAGSSSRGTPWRWLIPATAAAVALLVVMIWYGAGNTPSDTPGGGQIADNRTPEWRSPSEEAVRREAWASALEGSFGGVIETTQYAWLDDASRHQEELQELSEISGENLIGAFETNNTTELW